MRCRKQEKVNVNRAIKEQKVEIHAHEKFFYT